MVRPFPNVIMLYLKLSVLDLIFNLKQSEDFKFIPLHMNSFNLKFFYFQETFRPILETLFPNIFLSNNGNDTLNIIVFNHSPKVTRSFLFRTLGYNKWFQETFLKWIIYITCVNIIPWRKLLGRVYSDRTLFENTHILVPVIDRVFLLTKKVLFKMRRMAYFLKNLKLFKWISLTQRPWRKRYNELS